MEHGYRDEQAHSNAKPTAGSVEEQLETIQDDVNLLKIEIKQTLVDLREFILNSQTGFLPRTNGAQQSHGSDREDPPSSGSGRSRGKGSQPEEANGQASSDRRSKPSDSGTQQDRDFREDHRDDSRGGDPNGGYYSSGESSRRQPESNYLETLIEASKIGEIDVEMLMKLLAWLDSIKGKGISAEQVGSFLQAYESRGTLTATMSRIILQSIRAIGAKAGDSGDAGYSSEEYLGYLQQLHDIVCGVNEGRTSPSAEAPTGVRRIKAGPQAQD